MPRSSDIAQAQSTALDDTDCYASVWEEILDKQRKEELPAGSVGLWGGRGKGGRGLARRTIQPKNIVVHDVNLQYLLGDICLQGANLKLLDNHVYAMIGKNGCGKSTLLQRMHDQKIPGWSIAWSTLYIPSVFPQELRDKSPLQVVLHYYDMAQQGSTASTTIRIQELEEQLELIDADEEQEKLESICEELSILEDQLQSDQSSSIKEQQARDALAEFGIIDTDDQNMPCNHLSRGQRKRVSLAIAWVCSFVNLVLLDEPTDHLDVLGLVQLRRMIEVTTSTVVLVSHDVDLINDVATDIIEMKFNKLEYYPGNYDSYRLMKSQRETHELRHCVNLEKKKEKLKDTLQHLKQKPKPKHGGSKKKSKAVSSQRKKLERHELVEQAANATSTMSTSRKGLTAAQRLKLTELLKTVPDKTVQFQFNKTTSIWGEPLITALDVGHGFDLVTTPLSTNESYLPSDDGYQITKKEGFMFDCVDLCIEEGSKNCILGPTASGKSSLLKILAKLIQPVEGTVHHASGIRIGYFDADVVESILTEASLDETPLDYLQKSFPKKPEEDLRAQLTSFGVSPKTAKTPIGYLSGGEKCRFVLSAIMTDEPPVLCLDNPTSHLDVESVQALIYGLRQWNGTLIMVSEDFHFLRSLENVKCTVIVPDEGKLRRVPNGIDSYLKSFKF